MKNYAQRPESREYPAYFKKYIDRVPHGNILQILEGQWEELSRFFTEIGEEKARYRYHPDKWSIKEVLGHVIDTERIFAYRALSIARGEITALPGFEQDEYVENSSFNELQLTDLLTEFEDLRRANLSMIRNFSGQMMERQGIANKLEISVRAILWAMTGHVTHHLEIIQKKYL